MILVEIDKTALFPLNYLKMSVNELKIGDNVRYATYFSGIRIEAFGVITSKLENDYFRLTDLITGKPVCSHHKNSILAKVINIGENYSEIPINPELFRKTFSFDIHITQIQESLADSQIYYPLLMGGHAISDGKISHFRELPAPNWIELGGTYEITIKEKK